MRLVKRLLVNTRDSSEPIHPRFSSALKSDFTHPLQAYETLDRRKCINIFVVPVSRWRSESWRSGRPDWNIKSGNRIRLRPRRTSASPVRFPGGAFTENHRMRVAHHAGINMGTSRAASKRWCSAIVVSNASDILPLLSGGRRAALLQAVTAAFRIDPTPCVFSLVHRRMADTEFEEFRHYFERLPQHLKAPLSNYTWAIRFTFRIWKREYSLVGSWDALHVSSILFLWEGIRTGHRWHRFFFFEAIDVFPCLSFFFLFFILWSMDF